MGNVERDNEVRGEQGPSMSSPSGVCTGSLFECEEDRTFVVGSDLTLKGATRVIEYMIMEVLPLNSLCPSPILECAYIHTYNICRVYRVSPGVIW